MTFYTHDRTPRSEPKPLLKKMFIFAYGLCVLLFLFMAIAVSISIQNALPGMIILIVFICLNVFVSAFIFDIRKSYVQIEKDHITITEYYFFIKKEKIISIQKIKKAEVLPGVSFRLHGPRLSRISYIVLNDASDQYLFKIIDSPETREYFAKYFKIT